MAVRLAVSTLVVCMIASVGVACGSSPGPGTLGETKPPSTPTEITGWARKTQEWLLMGRAAEGGFGGLLLSDLQPTLYATYHALQAYGAIGAEPPDREGTIQWLRDFVTPPAEPAALYHQSVGLSPGNELTVIQMQVIGLDQLGTGPVNPAAVARLIREYQLDSGAFADSGGTPLPATRKAVEALAALGDLSGLENTERWLRDQWEALPVDENVETAGGLYLLASSFDLLGVDVASLPRHDEHAIAVEEALMKAVSDESATIAGSLGPLSDAAAALGIDQRPFAQSLSQRVADHRLPGGGFSPDGGPSPDVQTTAIVAKLMQRADPGWSQSDERTAIVSWLRGLAAEGGGTRQPILVHPDPNATALVLRSLDLLGSAEADHQPSRDYLRAQSEQGLDATTAGRLLLAIAPDELPRAARDQLIEAATTALDDLSGDIPGRGELDTIAAAAKVLDALAEIPPEQEDRLRTAVEALRDPDGCFGPGGQSILLVTLPALEIEAALGESPSNGPKCIDWLQAQQVSDGGFQTRTGSDLVSTYHAIVALALFDAEPRDIEAARRWLEDVRAERGFRYVPPSSPLEASEPDLSSTWFGLEVEALLEGD